jgi:hypothetical protein
LQGDANTNFFHTYANGRRRKIRICSLETDQGVITKQKDIENMLLIFTNVYLDPQWTRGGGALGRGFLGR